MPPALNKVDVKTVKCKNADVFPDDPYPPRWRLVSRRGVLLGYVWVRNLGFTTSGHPFAGESIWSIP